MKKSHITMYIALGVFIYLYVFWCFGFDSKCDSRWKKWSRNWQGPQPQGSRS